MSGPLFRALTPPELNALGVEDLEAIVAAVGRLREHQAIDPNLRRDILRRTDEAVLCGRITVAQAEQIRAELDEAVPAAVLEAHWKRLTPTRLLTQPALGSYRRAFPRRERVVDQTPSEWIAQDPERLRGVVAEAARFCNDWKRIVETATVVADSAGIPEELADPIIADAVRRLREERGDAS